MCVERQRWSSSLPPNVTKFTLRRCDVDVCRTTTVVSISPTKRGKIHVATMQCVVCGQEWADKTSSAREREGARERRKESKRSKMSIGCNNGGWGEIFLKVKRLVCKWIGKQNYYSPLFLDFGASSAATLPFVTSGPNLPLFPTHQKVHFLKRIF